MTPTAIPPIGTSCRIEVLGAPADAFGAITASDGGSAHTKGTWKELTPSTVFDYAAFYVYMSTRFSYNLGLLDIGLGSAGNETVIIPNLMIQASAGTANNSLGGRVFAAPIQIPSGTRISTRFQSEGTTNTARIVIWGLSASPFGFSGSRIEVYGVNTTTTRGTSIDPGGVSQTKGSWTNLVASTPSDILCLIVGFGSQGNTAPTLAGWHVDIGIGAGNDVLIPDLQTATTGESGTWGGAWTTGFTPPFPVFLPSGTQLKARASSNNTDTTDRLLDVVAYGVVP